MPSALSVSLLTLEACCGRAKKQYLLEKFLLAIPMTALTKEVNALKAAAAEDELETGVEVTNKTDKVSATISFFLSKKRKRPE